MTTVNLTAFNLTLTDLNALMSNTNKFMFNLFTFLVTTFVFIIILFFIYWLFKKEGVSIQPFEVGICSEKYSGRAISDLLISGLLKIRRIHSFNLAENKFESKEDFDMPSIAPSNENPNYDISNLNISGGPFAISLGRLLMILKRFVGHPENTITGSLQKYGSTTKLTAWIGPEKICSWEVESEKENIPFLMTELAYMIARYLSEKNIHAKTWQGFMYFTEALNWYNQYTKTKDEDKLSRSKDCCIQALGAEKDYKEPIYLLYNVGILYQDIGNNQELKEIFSQIVTFMLNTNTPIEWSIRGIANAYAGKYDEAIRAFNQAIQLDPNLADAWNNKGNVLVKQGRHEDAVKVYDEAVRLDPNYTKAWSNKGLALFNLGRYNEAIQAYDEAIRLDRNYAAAWYGKGAALSSQGKYDQALQACDKAIEINPQSVDAWNNKGYVNYRQGKYNEAVKAYDDAVRLDPNFYKAWYNEGNAFYNMRKYDEALQAYDKAIQLKPDYADAWYNKGVTLNTLGKAIEANAAFAKAKEQGYRD